MRALQHGRQIDGYGALVGGVVAREGKRGLQHGLHLVEIGGGLLLLLGVLDELSAQAPGASAWS